VMREAITDLIGKRVLARRTERELTQEQLAQLTGLTRQTISLIERGVVAPGWETLYTIAAILKCDVEELVPSLRQVQAYRA
jgi:transcriptional regulator with XRE-family HTH domain